MPGKIALVLPGMDLQAAARELFAQSREVLVYSGAEFHPERVVSRAREEGAAALVAPPPLSRSLQETGILPVVELEPSPFELLEALLRARQAGKPLVVIHFGPAGPDESLLSALTGTAVTCLHLTRDAEQVRESLKEVAERGAVVVGGRTTVQLARRLGVAGEAVIPGRAALWEALSRARAVLRALSPAGAVPGGASEPDEIPGPTSPEEQVVAASAAMKRAVALADRMAASPSPALIWGELGTGKSFLCAYIHRRSPWSEGELWAVSCAARATVEEKLGPLLGGERVGKGTLLLEEVEELPPAWQGQLAAFLEQEKEPRVRVLATTRGALKEAVDTGRFREDLYWRLSVLQLRVPPLREREEDLPLLLRTFWAELTGESLSLSPESWERLTRYRWPGNVRELRHFAQRYWLLGRGMPSLPPEEREKMALDDFLAAKEKESLLAPIPVIPGTLEHMQAQIMREMARRIKGSKAEVARRLGISRTTLWKRLKEAGRVSVSGEGIS